MRTPVVALYAGGPLGPADIAANLQATQDAGWNTIFLSLFHIGNPQNVPGQSWGDIIFNGSPVVISEGEYVAAASWPDDLARLKGSGSIGKIFASFGGGPPVVDFASIQTIYENNGSSFSGTMLERNFQLFRKTFPAIDGIDMDCEDNYDSPSFVAFCRMVAGMGFEVTFCPYTGTSFWTGALAELEQSDPGAVAWWNLQCYDGGAGNVPATWAAAIRAAVPGFSTDGYVVAGDWSRFRQNGYWRGDCPSDVRALISGLSDPSLGGGFIWNMDAILDDGPDPGGCGSPLGMSDYAAAVASAVTARAAAAR